MMSKITTKTLFDSPSKTRLAKFKLGEVMESGALLLGRATWQLFSHIWPGRSDDFSTKMNQMPKLVVSRSLERVDE